MSLIRKLAGITAALVVATLLFGAVTSTAQAQTSFFVAYGTGLSDGDTVEVFANGVSCGTITADADGTWVGQVGTDGSDASDCNAVAGDELTFTLNGEATTASETYANGGTPADAANGIALVVDMDTGGGDAGGQVSPPDTGNAGLVSSTASSSLWLMLALGALFVTLVTGVRTVTGRSR